MITVAEYNRIAAKKWQGVRVRSLRAIATRYAEVPPGTIFTIEQKFGGFALKSDPCPHCGIQFHVVKVEPQALERIEVGE